MNKAFLFPLVVVGLLLAFPLIEMDARDYILLILFTLFLNIVLAQSYDIVGGQMGYVNLGHIVFFAIGAYAFGIFLNAQLGFVLSLIGGAGASVAFAALISYPFFRLRGAYFSLAAFGLVKLMEYVPINMGALTGGSNGLKIEAGDRVVPIFYLSLAVVVAVVICSWLIGRSQLGLAMKTIREDEEVARDFGVPVLKIKVQALLISSFFPGLMGGLYTWQLQFIDTDQVFGLKIALTPIAMAMLGGSGLLIGPIIGAVFLVGVEELIWTQLAQVHWTVTLLGYEVDIGQFAHLRGAILGLIIVLVGLFMPGGFARLPPVERMLTRAGLMTEDK